MDDKTLRLAGNFKSATEGLKAVRQGMSPDNPLPTLEWLGDEKPPSWWGMNSSGELTKVYRDYSAYCSD